MTAHAESFEQLRHDYVHLPWSIQDTEPTSTRADIQRCHEVGLAQESVDFKDDAFVWQKTSLPSHQKKVIGKRLRRGSGFFWSATEPTFHTGEFCGESWSGVDLDTTEDRERRVAAALQNAMTSAVQRRPSENRASTWTVGMDSRQEEKYVAAVSEQTAITRVTTAFSDTSSSQTQRSRWFYRVVVRGVHLCRKERGNDHPSHFAEEGIRFNVARSEFEPLSVELWRELGDGNASSQLDEESGIKFG